MRTRLASVLLALTGIVVACSSNDAKPKTVCTPNKPSYCRCQDREQGEKTCAADGNSYGPCIPCETADNPEIPYEPTGPGDHGFGDDDDVDGGSQVPDDASKPGGPKCGDGIVQTGEDCDDKNTTDDDGCNGDCKLQGGTAQATTGCPGLNVDVWGGAHKPTVTGTTVGGGSHGTKADCTTSGSTTTRGNSANDRTFHVTAHKQGSMMVTVADANFNAFVYVAKDCADPVVHTSCVNKVNGPGAETLLFGVTEGGSYTVFVDGGGVTGNTGTFKVTFEIN